MTNDDLKNETNISNPITVQWNCWRVFLAYSLCMPSSDFNNLTLEIEEVKEELEDRRCYKISLVNSSGWRPSNWQPTHNPFRKFFWRPVIQLTVDGHRVNQQCRSIWTPEETPNFCRSLDDLWIRWKTVTVNGFWNWWSQ